MNCTRDGEREREREEEGARERAYAVKAIVLIFQDECLSPALFTAEPDYYSL